MKVALCWLLLFATIAAAQDGEEKVNYLRVHRGKTTPECTFSVKPTETGRRLRCYTHRPGTEIYRHVVADYDMKDNLLNAAAIEGAVGQEARLEVEVVNGKANVERDRKVTESFAVPPGVIVTSAPDWSDVIMLCQRYDRKKGGRQEFTGLWIHPIEPAQLLTFVIDTRGTDTIQHEGNKVELTRHILRIRNNSMYMAWADDKGHMVRLVSLPLRDTGNTVLVKDGYEKSTAALQPR